MPNFTQMGGIPLGYDQLLNSARQQLVKMPDGTYQQMPQFGAGTSLDKIYGGILPPPSVPGPLKTRTVPTVPVDNLGNPIIAKAPTMAATRTEQNGARQAITPGAPLAGSTVMAAARPPSIPVPPTNFQLLDGGRTQTAMAPVPRPRPLGSPVWDPFGTNVPKEESRLAPSDPRMAFIPDAQNQALGAIDDLMGSGNSVQPRPSPFGYAAPPQATAKAPPAVPAPRGGNLGPITFKKGDTVGKLAKARGMTVNAFADLYGIANPNKIYAGATVIPKVPMPRTPTMAQRKPPSTSRADRFAGVLDEFGMIR